MDPTSLLEVNIDQLKNVDAKSAVLTFKALLYAEARSNGCPISAIRDISTRVNTPDKGIDASIDEFETEHELKDVLINSGITGYQIKSGASFKPWNDLHIKKELFGNKEVDKANLKEHIKKVLDDGGRYFLVHFGVDAVGHEKNAIQERITGYLKACGYDNTVEYVDATQLSLYLERYPSLVARVNNFTDENFEIHDTWARDREMRVEYVPRDSLIALKATIYEHLISNSTPNHMRLIADPGIGKTRLLFEVTKADELQPLTLYFPSARLFRESRIRRMLKMPDSNYKAVLVIDECSEQDYLEINREFENNTSVRIVSLYTESDASSSSIPRPVVEDWSEDDIAKILFHYTNDELSAQHYARFCEGYPRFAHVIGEHLSQHREGIRLLTPTDTVDPFNLLLTRGEENPSSEEVALRKRILRYVALFKRFGYGGSNNNEAHAVHELIQSTGSEDLTWHKFKEVIDDLRRRKILQGDRVLYISPKAMHIYWWLRWWDEHADDFDYHEFTEELTPEMKTWFQDMIVYAGDSDEAKKRVEQLLNDEGNFGVPGFLNNEENSRFFLILSEASPKTALKILEKTIGVLNFEQLKDFNKGRRNIVWALEKMVVWEDLFERAARILLKLAVAENENYANNATGEFIGLFSVHPSPTAAPPGSRWPLLKECLESHNGEIRKIALQACDIALSSRSYRMIGAEHQGLRTLDLWAPKNEREYIDSLMPVWLMLNDFLLSSEGKDNTEAASILTQNSRRLLQFSSMKETVLDSMEKWISEKSIPSNQLIKLVEQLLHYDGKNLDSQTVKRLKKMQNTLNPDDYSSRMQRYVAIDLLTDKFDDDQKHVDKTEADIERLAAESVKNPELLYAELDWLLSSEPKNAYNFAYALGKADVENVLLEKIIKAFIRRLSDKETNTSDLFLGGYLRALAEKDINKWNKAMDHLVAEDSAVIWIPSLTWRCHVSDKSLERVLSLVKAGKITSPQMKIFGYASVMKGVSESFFHNWIQFFLEEGSIESLSCALDHFQFYYIDKKRETPHLPKELASTVLLHPTNFAIDEEKKRDTMDDFAWKEIAKAYIKEYPEDCGGLLQMMVENFGIDGTMFESYRSDAAEVLALLAKNDPHQTWIAISKHLAPPIDERAYSLSHWLHGISRFSKDNSGPLDLFEPEDVWEWVEEDIESRAWYLATFVPKKLHRESGKVCWPREILVRYGHREDVRNNLRANFGTEGWSGPTSSHLKKKKEMLLAFKADEKNSNVKMWIDEYIEYIDGRIEIELESEERQW